MHLRFGQRIARAHAVTDKEVFNQVRREVHHLAVRVAHIGQRTNAALGIARVGVDQVRCTQLAIGVVDGQAVRIQNFRGQGIFFAWHEPTLIGVVDKRRVGDVFAPKSACIEMVVAQPFDVLAQGRGEGAFFG